MAAAGRKVWAAFRPQRAPNAGERPAYVRRRWRTVAGGLVVAAAAAAVAIAVSAGWLVPVPSQTAGYVLQSAPAPRGWHSVSYQGVRLAVPASWPVVNLPAHPRVCPRIDVHAVYLGTPGPHPQCPASGLGAKTEAVQIEVARPDSPQVVGATRNATIGGARALTNQSAGASHTITDVFPTVRAQVELTYGSSESLIRRVESTIAVASRTAGGKPFAAARGATLPAQHSQGLVKGAGFDTCSAPGTSAMRAWLQSRYRSVGVYIGGADEACAQPNLSASWISTVERKGWHVFPLYPGPQAPCVNAGGNVTFSASGAAHAGAAAGGDAAAQARHLRLPPGTPLIYDMEGYSGCGSAVVKFVNAWDRKLHDKGYAAGVYESAGNIPDLSRARHSMTEPDVLFYAAWDGHDTTNSSYVPSNMWTNHQRIHQYIGNTVQTFGGVSLGIDVDRLNVNLGGVTAQGRPQTAVVDSGGTVRVYDRGAAGGSLWEDHLPSSKGSPWTWFDMRGKWPATPTAVIGSDGTVHVYGVGTDGHLYVRTLPSGGRWSGWKNLGGKWPWNPVAVAGPSGTIRVFMVGTNGHLYQKRLRSDGSWSGWADVGSSNLTGTPAATYDATGTVHVYVRSAAASHTMRVATLPAGQPWAWHNLQGSWRYDPAVVAASDGSARVYAVGTDGRLYQKRLRSDGSWATWTDVGGSRLKGTPAAVTDTSGATRVFTRLKTGGLKEEYVGPGSPWAGKNLHGTWHYDPSAVVDSTGIVRVYAVGTSGKIYEDHLGAGKSTWSGWFGLGGPS